MSQTVEKNTRPDYDKVIQQIANYVCEDIKFSKNALNTAKLCLIDSLGCAILALNYDACKKMLGPIVPGASLENGARVPGTTHRLDPVQAAFNIGTLVRWLDFNDTWLAAEWGHPSDNLGAILAISDYLSRNNNRVILVEDILIAMIKAHEIQGVMALENSFNRVGLDHVILVKLASAAIVAKLLGGDKDMIMRTVSHVFVDGQSLRTYRHAPNTGSRKSWAAGDATARAVQLAFIAKKGEMGYPSALTAKNWGFYDVLFKGQEFKFQRPFGSYVMENILFKLSFPAEFHAQTAVECAVEIHEKVKERIDDIETIELATHESAIRIISKEGPLHNPADRDHCLQYMVAIGLICGNLEAKHYEDDFAQNPLIDKLREKMIVQENKAFSIDYLDPSKRAIANSLQVFFKDGSKTEKLTIEYPIGHRKRRAEGELVLKEKFIKNLKTQFSDDKTKLLTNLMYDDNRLLKMPITELMDFWSV